MHTQLIQVGFDFASSYSYPAVLRVTPLAAANRLSLHWRFYILGVIFKEQGWNSSAFNLYPLLSMLSACTCWRVPMWIDAAVRLLKAVPVLRYRKVKVLSLLHQ